MVEVKQVVLLSKELSAHFYLELIVWSSGYTKSKEVLSSNSKPVEKGHLFGGLVLS